MIEFSKIMKGELAWEDAATFMHYVNMSEKTTTVMPKFILFSGHSETVAPILQAFKTDRTLKPDPASMVLVNFYGKVDDVEDTEAETEIHVEIKFVPHLRLSDEVQTIASMPVDWFERQIADSLFNYIYESGVKTRFVPDMCKETYVRNPDDSYGDPW